MHGVRGRVKYVETSHKVTTNSWMLPKMEYLEHCKQMMELDTPQVNRNLTVSASSNVGKIPDSRIKKKSKSRRTRRRTEKLQSKPHLLETSNTS